MLLRLDKRREYPIKIYIQNGAYKTGPSNALLYEFKKTVIAQRKFIQIFLDKCVYKLLLESV